MVRSGIYFHSGVSLFPPKRLPNNENEKIPWIPDSIPDSGTGGGGVDFLFITSYRGRRGV